MFAQHGSECEEWGLVGRWLSAECRLQCHTSTAAQVCLLSAIVSFSYG